MNNLKKISGWFWMALALVAVALMCYRAQLEIAAAYASGKAGDVLNQWMFWGIIIPVFTPIMAGLALFGWYAWKGEYDRVADNLPGG